MYPLKIMLALIIQVLLYFLPCFTAQDLVCTVYQLDNGQTVYRIPDFNHSNCESSWAEPDKTVLATQPTKQPQPGTKVVSNNETTLITKTCINVTLYQRDCTSEESVRTATCIATCTGLSEPGKGHDIWKIFVYVAIPAVIVLLCVVIFFTFRAVRRHDKIRELARSFLKWPDCLTRTWNDPTTDELEDVCVQLNPLPSPQGPNPGP